jgi:hypothetical protein
MRQLHLFLLVAVACMWRAAGAHDGHHHCAHDKIPHAAPATSHVLYHEHPHETAAAEADDTHPTLASSPQPARRLDLAGSAAPMRIKWRLVDVADAAVAAYLNTEVLPAAIGFWASTLKVVPVSGALFFPPFCTATFSDPAKTCASVGSASAQTCSSIPVPVDLVGSRTTCKTGPGKGCVEQSAGGEGSASTDLMLLVTAKETTNCEASTHAYASHCATDQYVCSCSCARACVCVCVRVCV